MNLSPTIDLPLLSWFSRQFLVAELLLITWFCFSLNIARAEVTELPPIKKTEKSQAKPIGNVRSPPSPNVPVNRGTDPSSTASSGSPGEMDGLSAGDRALIVKACRRKQYRGPAAYHECEREQAAAVRNSAPVSFKGVSDFDRSLIAKACRSKQYHGPAAFRSCERDQVESLKTSSVPSFDGVSNGDRAMIAKACRTKQYYGLAAYRACQRDQISQLKFSQTPSPVRRQ